MRCDFNVPLDEEGNVADDFRIKQELPTINYLLQNNAKVILITHLDPESTGVADQKYNLEKIKENLEKLLKLNIIKSPENLKDGEVCLLENLRFDKGETEGSLEFAKKLAEMGEIYVNDAFSVCHRSHASISLVPKFLPGCAGFLLENEVKNLDKVLNNPKKPMMAIVGGKKVETKSKFINNISKIADWVIISGLVAKEAKDKNIEFSLQEKIVAPEDNLDALDIDKNTIKIFTEKILQSKTVLWNGPFGKFEEKKYAAGTLAIAKAIIKSRAFSVVGGGETVEFVRKYGLFKEFSWVSTGGGAMMTYLSGEELPGLAALEK